MGPACAYVRVSSRSQTHAMQLAALERAASAMNDHFETIYSEKMSAKTTARPELNRVRVDARAGKIGRLYVFRLDRLARSGIRDMLEIVEELRSHGCRLVTVADGFDLEGPAAEIVLAVMAWAAKMERLAINERISAARERMETQGRKWGRPRCMNDVAIARAVEMQKAGRTVRQIAVAIKVSRETVRQALVKARTSTRTGG